MKKIWVFTGIIAYWLTLPLLYLYLRRSQRTRMLIRSGESIVVVKPWLGNGKWILPGGGKHRYEDAVQAAIREVCEETGLNISKVKTVGTFLYQQNGLHFYYTLFQTSLNSTERLKRQSLELVDIAWRSTRQLNANNANPDVLQALKKL